MANPPLIVPSPIRAVAFVDGQNLYRHAKEAFGYHYPNYDPVKLHDAVCAQKGWEPHGVRFYTGAPAQARQPMWHAFWSKRLLAMRHAGIFVFSREIRYRTEQFALPDGAIYEVDTAQEKGVDVRIAIDLMRLALSRQYDVAVIFSQDQDLSEVAIDIREVSRSSGRWIKLACAFPSSPTASSGRGIDRTDWVPMDKAFYDACIDPRDYRPASSLQIPNPIPLIRLKEAPPG